MATFLHTFVPDPIIVSLGPLSIYWYGLFAGIGLTLAWLVIEKLQKRYGIKEDLFPLFIGTVIAGLLGARIYHVLNEFAFYIDHPLLIVQIWNGGLALHGGIAGAVLYGYYWVRRHNLPFPRILDIFVTGGILVQIFGRFGNYFNQELFGSPTRASWGIPISEAFRPQGYENFLYFHPTFLYEALLNIVLFLFLLILHRGVLSGTMKLRKGYIFLFYLLFYSVIRIVMELLRIDATPILFGVRLPIIVSSIAIIVIVLFFIKDYVYKKENFS